MLSYLNDPTKELLGKIGGGVKAESSNTGNLLWDNPQDNNQRNDVLLIYQNIANKRSALSQE